MANFQTIYRLNTILFGSTFWGHCVQWLDKFTRNYKQSIVPPTPLCSLQKSREHQWNTTVDCFRRHHRSNPSQDGTQLDSSHLVLLHVDLLGCGCYHRGWQGSIDVQLHGHRRCDRIW